MAILELNGVSFTYDKRHNVLENATYSFDSGKMYAIVGRSGAGKTTLLSLLSALTKPTAGTITFDGKDIAHIDPYTYRSKCVGVVFQSFNLLPHLTALENVELSMEIAGVKGKGKRQKALELLEKVELDEERARRPVLQLSGGEQQRVAIARALSYDPQVLLADEPTGNLDEETEQSVIAILRRLAEEENKCVIVVTHAAPVADAADEVYTLVRNTKQEAPPKKKKSSTLDLD
ncbi:MAG: ABC transporter ATP-binding protein [Clostridia bacterium]|nr:ABC transporter ATP-binding protein [Clostridia bacterium]